MTGTEDTQHRTTVINLPEAVGVFDSFEALQQAFYDLRMVGFSRYDISLLGSEQALKEKLGDRFWQASELEDDPEAPAPPSFRKKPSASWRAASRADSSSWDHMSPWPR